MSASPETWAVLLAAGSGTRLAEATEGRRKQFLPLDGAPLYWRSAQTLAALPALRGLVFVFPESELEQRQSELREWMQRVPLGLPWKTVPGGKRRQDSVRHGLRALPRECGRVLVHDAARPFASPALILRVLDALEQGASGVVPGLAVTDTIKSVDCAEQVLTTLDRAALRAVQTPQGFDRSVLETAHEQALTHEWDVTDDASMVERLAEQTPHAAPGGVVVVPGEEINMKITTPADLERLRPQQIEQAVTGFGYDVHRYAGKTDTGPVRSMVLGGVPIPKAPGVLAHSDGDVLLHALTDAILGCCGGGDIGDHFPDNAEENENRSSAVFVKEAQALARQRGTRIVSVDLTVIAQIPRLGPHKEHLRENVARLLELPMACVNIKATTEEHLGFTGEKRGIKAVALVSALRDADCMQ